MKMGLLGKKFKNRDLQEIYDQLLLTQGALNDLDKRASQLHASDFYNERFDILVKFWKFMGSKSGVAYKKIEDLVIGAETNDKFGYGLRTKFKRLIGK